jgi:hypothetical protein
VAFLSDRGGDATNGTAVWIAPATGPGEARLLASFPVSVDALEWHHETSAIVVAASVYVDDAAKGSSGFGAMEATAARDKALAEVTPEEMNPPHRTELVPNRPHGTDASAAEHTATTRTSLSGRRQHALSSGRHPPLT